jgi:hypothetical protein
MPRGSRHATVPQQEHRGLPHGRKVQGCPCHEAIGWGGQTPAIREGAVEALHRLSTQRTWVGAVLRETLNAQGPEPIALLIDFPLERSTSSLIYPQRERKHNQN